MEIRTSFDVTPKNLTCPPTPPGAAADYATVSEDSSVIIDVLANDYEVDPTSVSIVTLPTHGTISGVNPTNGEVTYTPSGDYYGPDSFEYIVLYNTGEYSPPTLVNILVTAEVESTDPLNIALVVGRPSNLHSDKDVPLKNHIESLLGPADTLTLFDDNDKTWDPSEYNAIIISESVSSSKTKWLKQAPTGILTVEGANSDELAMGDGGSSSKGKSNSIVIAANHPITQGFAGTIQVTTINNHLGHMTDKNSWFGTDIQLLAYYSTGGDIKAKILAVEKGGELNDGSEAKGKRVFLGAQYFAHLNDNGKTLFNQALQWILWTSEDYSGIIDLPPVITLNGASEITINQGDAYIEYGATATDDGVDISDMIIIDDDSIDTNFPALYTINYQVMDSSGQVAEVSRNVQVVDITSTHVLEIALVCKRTNCTNDNKDEPLMEHLIDLGHQITTINDDDQFDTTGYDLIVISESVLSSKTAWLKDVNKPILTVEGANSDELAMGDGGSSSAGKSKYVIIDDPESHPITAGLGIPAGVPIQVTTSTSHLGHMTGYEGTGVQELAHYDSSGTEKAKILVVNAGATLFDGTPAENKRVFFGAQYFDKLNDLGVALFDQALYWAAN